jgi:hypothetical protein
MRYSDSEGVSMWIITKEEGIELVHPIQSKDYSDLRLPELKYCFRMFDSDGNIGFEGMSNVKDFSPIDEYGGPVWGCTSIEYWNEDDRVWELL